MADSLPLPISPLQRAINALQLRLGGVDGDLLTRLPSPPENCDASFAFQLPDDYLGIGRALHVHLLKDLTIYGVRLRVVPDPGLAWPHVTDGAVCLYGPNTRPVTATPETIVNDAIDQFNTLFTSFVAPTSPESARKAEFEKEIVTYWNNQLTTLTTQAILLETPNSATSLYVLSDVRQRSNIWLSSTTAELAKFSKRLNGRSKHISAPLDAGFFLPLESFPSLAMPSSENWISWLNNHVTDENNKVFREWEKKTRNFSQRWILLQLPGAKERTVYCVSLLDSYIRKPQNQLYGSRAKRRFHKPEKTTERQNIYRARLQVIDRQKVHSRNTHVSNSSLSNATIALVGVGALGSMIASQLARAGVGKLLFIDPDVFNDGNLGRHVLGINELGFYKSEMLRARLQNDVPNCLLRSSPVDVVTALRDTQHDIHSCDLVIVTTADWPSEVALWHEMSKGAQWKLIQGWSEPHGEIGHALFSPDREADARNLFTAEGNYLYPYSHWENNGVIDLPACGSSYIPGGPIALNAISTMISRLAVEVITGEITRPLWQTIIGSPSAIVSAGGTYTGPVLQGGSRQITLSREWPEGVSSV